MVTGGSSWVETAPLSMLRNNCCSAALCSGPVNTTHSDQSLSCPESAPLNTEYIHQMLSYCNERCRHVHRICTEAAALLGLLSAAAQWAGGGSHQARARGKKCDSVTIDNSSRYMYSRHSSATAVGMFGGSVAVESSYNHT